MHCKDGFFPTCNEGEKAMLKGMKAKRQLAAFVALAVGGAFAGAPEAYAAESATVGTGGAQTGINGVGTAANPYGDIVGTNLMKGSVTDNTLTIGAAGTTNLPVVVGDISAGGTSTTTTAVTGNKLVINSLNLTGNAYGGIGLNIAQVSGSAQTNPNTVKMNDGIVKGAVIGVRSAEGGVANGGVELAGGTLTARSGTGTVTDGIAIAGGMGKTSAIDNKVTIANGTVTGKVYGGYAENAGGGTTGNRVFLGDVNGSATPNLSNASLYGGSNSTGVSGGSLDAIRNNHLIVQTKGITANSAQNFHTYEFHLNTGVAAGNTMLTLTHNNDAFGRAVAWEDIKVDATGWSGKGVNAQGKSVQDYFGDVGTVTLMADGNTATNRTSNLRFSNYTSPGTTDWSGDYEYRIKLRTQTDTATSTTRNYVDAELHRYQNANHTHTGALSGRNTIYGGYSIWENLGGQTGNKKVVQDNTLVLNNATGFVSGYGGYTSTGADAVRNKLTLNSGTIENLFGGVATGTGLVDHNEVTVADGTVTGDIFGGKSDNLTSGNGIAYSGTGTVTNNSVTVNKGTVNRITGGYGTTTVSSNSVAINGGANASRTTVYPVVRGEVKGGAIRGDNSVDRKAEQNTVTITEGDIQATVYGVFGELFGAGSSTNAHVQLVNDNHVKISGGSAHKIYGAYLTGYGTVAGTGTATNNSVEISGTAKVSETAYGAAANGNASLTANSVTVKGGAVHDVYGATANGTGAVKGNSVTIENGRVDDNVVGGENTSTSTKAGSVTGNTVTVKGGEIVGDIFGGVTYAAKPSSSGSTGTTTTSGGNTVTITGGTLTGGTRPDGTLRGNVYGGYARGSDPSVEQNNEVNLGANDGSYTANLTQATIYGGHSTAAGNTLNVKGQDITVKGVHNFTNYNFYLTDKVDKNATMLKVTDHNGFENQYSGTTPVNFSNVKINLQNMSAKQIAGRVTLLEGNGDNALKFQKYTPTAAWQISPTHSDYEYALRLVRSDGTEAPTGTTTGRRVLLDYNRFQNGNVAYDTTSDDTDWFAGRSYGGHTTEHNILTIDKPLSRNITAYGAKTMGASGGSGGTRGNTLEIKSTGSAYQVTAGYGGYIHEAGNSGKVENNVLRMSGGKTGTLYGGYSAGMGEVSGNNVYVTGGTVSGNIYAGYAASAGQAKGNTLTLGADDGSYGATIAGNIYGANDSGAGTGNTLVVQAGNVSVQQVKNFDTFKFVLHNDTLIDHTMLKIEQTGGLGGTINMANITEDVSKFHLNPTWTGSHSVKLIESNGQMTFSNYAKNQDRTSKYANTNYEVYLHTEDDQTQGSDLLLTFNRLRDGDRSYDSTNASAADSRVFTGISAMNHDVENNKLRITGVHASGIDNYATAGVTTGTSGSLKNNMLTIDSANALKIRDVYGAYAANTSTSSSSGSSGGSGSGSSGSGSGSSTMSGNGVILTRGALTGNIYGAKSESKVKADSNYVTVLGGSVSGSVYGGWSTSDDAQNNNVSLSSVHIGGDVVGGYGKSAKNNSITLRGTEVAGSVYGGKLTTGVSASAKDGNTLNVYDMGAKVGYFEDFQNLNFYLSPRADLSKSMLTTTQAKNKDISGSTITMELDGGYAPVGVGDDISLVRLPDAQNIVTANNLSGTTYQTTKGVTLDYEYTLNTRGTASTGTKNELFAHVTNIKVKDETKSLVETQAAAIAFLASGSDLLTDVGIPAAEAAAIQIADIVDTPYAGSEKNSAAASVPLSTLGSYQLFAAQSFGSMRLKSGSYVDTKGWNLNVGYARRNELVDRSLTFGPFIEYGRGNYDSYLDDGTHGSGKTDYLGVGVMAKSESDNGTYLEGSLRVGRAKSDYSGNIGAKSAGYDLSSGYFAGHIGVGQKREFINGSKIDTYAKYFYAHQAGTSATLSTGETYDFGASTSSRIRFGTRYTVKNDLNGEFYAGLAWEYEFDGKGSASYQGYDLPGTSLKGSTTLLELGYRFAPVDSTVSYGLNLTGFQGKRKGITGGFNIAWAF